MPLQASLFQHRGRFQKFLRCDFFQNGFGF
nr:MAG TPA: hypothetical protein [Caudoviricetes sp.]DAQ91701.1 MAG TPA: hypothetical protein [Caudoviricetes sp.]